MPTYLNANAKQEIQYNNHFYHVCHYQYMCIASVYSVCIRVCLYYISHSSCCSLVMVFPLVKNFKMPGFCLKTIYKTYSSVCEFICPARESAKYIMPILITIHILYTFQLTTHCTLYRISLLHCHLRN